MVEKSEFFRLIDEMRDFGQELCDLRKALALDIAGGAESPQSGG